jgi:ArsR family transcriptional regulator
MGGLMRIWKQKGFRAPSGCLLALTTVDMDHLAEFIDGCQYGGVSKQRAALPTLGVHPEGLEPCCPSILSGALDEPAAAELARGFAALADPARLRLFSLIAAQPEREVCACALVEPLGRSQPTVSHHLRVLFEAGLVDREKRGTWVWYRVAPGRLDALRATLEAAPQTATVA